MEPAREGFDANDPTMGPQQSDGLHGGTNMDSAAVSSDNASINGTQSVDGSAGAIPFGDKTQG